MRLLTVLAAVSALGALSGCSTILTGPTQKVAVNSRPAGARVYVDGVRSGTTPTHVTLLRSREHDITIQLAGWVPQTVHLKRSGNPWNWGNAMYGVFPGVVVDAGTGAIYKLKPAEVEVDLFPRGVRRRPLPAGEGHHHSSLGRTAEQLLVATTDAPRPEWEKIGQMERLQ